MAGTTEEQKKEEQKTRFDEINEKLAVPEIGNPLTSKWKQPRPDKNALEDFPGEKEQRDKWIEGYTSPEGSAAYSTRTKEKGGMSHV